MAWIRTLSSRGLSPNRRCQRRSSIAACHLHNAISRYWGRSPGRKRSVDLGMWSIGKGMFPPYFEGTAQMGQSKDNQHYRRWVMNLPAKLLWQAVDLRPASCSAAQDHASCHRPGIVPGMLHHRINGPSWVSVWGKGKEGGEGAGTGRMLHAPSYKLSKSDPLGHGIW